jgi:citrate lyase subunit beta/citryl-CoA lyase
MTRLRSLLFTPGHEPRMLAKAIASDADALIFDLEDAVPAERKREAREVVREHLARIPAGRNAFVRVNAVGTGLIAEDLDAVLVAGLAGIWLSKAEAEHIASVDSLLAELERDRGLARGSTAVYASLETARGVWAAHAVASASDRVRGVSAGTAEWGDLQAELGNSWSPEGSELLYVRSHVLLAARAAGLGVVVDGAHADFRDHAGHEVAAVAARRLGYTGKMVIHPSQVEVVNRIFSPTPEELDRARRVLAAFEAALQRGTASTSLDGRMIDYAMAETARRVLEQQPAPETGSRT